MKTLAFTVPGEPIGVNRSFAGGARPFAKTREAREYAKLVAGLGWQARCVALRDQRWPALSESACEVWITLYFGSERPDADGPVKPILDALQPPRQKPVRYGASIYANDRQVVDYHVRRRIDRQNPRVEIIIQEVAAPLEVEQVKRDMRAILPSKAREKIVTRKLMPSAKRYGG